MIETEVEAGASEGIEAEALIEATLEVPQTLGEAVALLVRLDDEHRAAELAEKRAKARLKSVAAAVKNLIVAAGLSNVKTTDPPRTVYLRQIFGVSVNADASQEAVAEALDELGYPETIKMAIPPPTLRKIVQGLLQHDESGKPVLPENLAPLLKVYEDHDVAVRLA